MDDEYTESVDISSDMGVSDVDVADDVPADIPDDIPEDVPEGTSSDMDVTDDITEDVSDDEYDDSGDYDETDDFVDEDTVEPSDDASDDVQDEIPEDTYEDTDEASEGEIDINDIPEDTDESDLDSDDGISDVGWDDIPEDTDVVSDQDAESSYEEDIPEDVTDSETADTETADTSEQTENAIGTDTTDVDGTDTAEQPEDMTDAETADEISDVDDTDTAEQPQNVTDAETTDEASDIDETDTAEQPEDVTDAEIADENVDATDSDRSDLETYDYETAPETQDSVNPETSGEYVSAENPYRERWEEFAEEFSDGDDKSGSWDSLKDVPFARDEQGEAMESTDTSPTTESSETPEINSISDYMNAHNYGPDDFATYSQGPVWRELHSAAFPDDELPPLDDGRQEQKKPVTAQSGGNNPPPPNGSNGEGGNPPSNDSHWVCPVCGQDPCICEKDGSDDILPPGDLSDGSSKVLKRDEFDLLKSGNDAINQRLEAQADDYRDKGLSEKEITERLATDKWNFQKEFLDDAFPGQDVSPNVFNGFNEHGAEDRLDEIDNSPVLRDTLIGDGEFDASVVNSEYNAENDVPILPRTSDLDRKMIDIFPVNRREAIDTAFSDAPPELMTALNEYTEGLNHIEDSGYAPNKYGKMVKLGCYYEDGSDTITMDEHMTDAEYSEVFPHEFGHYIDCQRGWESTGVDFTNAIQKDIALFDQNTPEGKMHFHDMLDDAFSTGAAYDRAVSDILSAMFKNDPYVVQRFKSENVAYYQHEDSYWDIPGMIQKEIYANNMAVQVSQTRISKNFIERWFGSTDYCFKSKFGLNNKLEV